MAWLVSAAVIVAILVIAWWMDRRTIKLIGRGMVLTYGGGRRGRVTRVDRRTNTIDVEPIQDVDEEGR